MGCDGALSVDAESNPVGPIIPVDAIAVLQQDAADGGSSPVGGDVAAAVEIAARALPRFVLQIEIAAVLVDGTGAGAIPIRIPGAGEIRPASATTAAVVAARPVASVGPVDLAAVSAQRAGDELPSRRLNLIVPLKISRRGIAVLVGQGKKDAVAGDGGVFGGISLRAPGAEKSRALAAILKQRSGSGVERWRCGETTGSAQRKSDGPEEAAET